MALVTFSIFICIHKTFSRTKKINLHYVCVFCSNTEQLFQVSEKKLLHIYLVKIVYLPNVNFLFSQTKKKNIVSSLVIMHSWDNPVGFQMIQEQCWIKIKYIYWSIILTVRCKVVMQNLQSVPPWPAATLKCCLHLNAAYDHLMILFH